MPKSHRSSHASEICRLDWRPSRLLAGGLAVIGLLAAFAAIASEMPQLAAWPLACAAALQGLRLALLESRRPVAALVWNGHTEVVTIDGIAVADPALRWRGPIACLRYRDAQGGWQRLIWWPDTLPARRRRELRLAAAGPAPARHRASMAP